MVLSGIYILDMKGKVLISRNYRGDIETNVIDKFIGLVMDREEDGTLTPLLQTEEATFAFIRRNNLYVVATTKKNSNIAMVFCLLHKVCAVRIEILVKLWPGMISDMLFVKKKSKIRKLWALSV